MAKDSAAETGIAREGGGACGRWEEGGKKRGGKEKKC
jgi:hypothetical protein